MRGIVFNIQRFSIHDGPGIRTTVFLKGCPLSCYWCHNPEGLRPVPELRVYPQLCIGCGACVKVCPEGAQALVNRRKEFRRKLCKACGRCVEECFSGALVLTGRRMSVAEVMAAVLADRAFYESSGGGVTLSGGEPLMQRQFSREILEACKAEGIHTAVETAGHCPWKILVELLPHIDLVMMDLKHMDPEKHRRGTGVSNERILANARRLARTAKELLFRIPVIPEVNDTPEEIGALADFVLELRGTRGQSRGRTGPAAAPGSLTLELLPFHPLGADKYRSLDMPNRTGGMKPLPAERLEELKRAAGLVEPAGRSAKGQS